MAQTTLDKQFDAMVNYARPMVRKGDDPYLSPYSGEREVSAEYLGENVARLEADPPPAGDDLAQVFGADLALAAVGT